MFCKKDFLGKLVKYKTERINFCEDVGKLPLKTQGYNFIIENGLCSGLGLREITIPDAGSVMFLDGLEVKKAWSYRFFSDLAKAEIHLLILYCADKKLYRISLSADDLYALDLGTLQINEVPEMLAYRIDNIDRAIFYNKNEIVFWTSEAPPYVPNVSYKIKSAAVFANKIFAGLWGDEYRLRYCDVAVTPDFIITTAPDEDAGEIKIRKEFGAIIKILNFFDCLVVVTEFGVLRVDISENGDFVLTECFLSDAKIYAETIVVCGNKILMLTSLGVYVFDGKKAKKSDILDILPYGSHGKPIATYFDGKYYLALQMPFDSDVVGEEAIPGFVNNVLVMINPDTMHKDVMRGFDICSFTPVVEDNYAKLFVVTRGSGSIGEFCADGEIFGVPLKKTFKLLNFGADSIGKKVIRSVSLKGTLDCLLKIEGETDEKIFNIEGGRTERFMANVISETFNIELQSCGSGKIDMLEIEFAKI